MQVFIWRFIKIILSACGVAAILWLLIQLVLVGRFLSGPDVENDARFESRADLPIRELTEYGKYNVCFVAPDISISSVIKRDHSWVLSKLGYDSEYGGTYWLVIFFDDVEIKVKSIGQRSMSPIHNNSFCLVNSENSCMKYNPVRKDYTYMKNCSN